MSTPRARIWLAILANDWTEPKDLCGMLPSIASHRLHSEINHMVLQGQIERNGKGCVGVTGRCTPPRDVTMDEISHAAFAKAPALAVKRESEEA